MHTKMIDAKLLLEFTRNKIDIIGLVNKFDEYKIFTDEDESEALLAWKKSFIRRALRSVKDSEGFPLIFSIVELDRAGNEIRKYKQEALFSIGEYKQAIEYCRQHKKYWGKMERRLLRNAKDKFGEQTELFG